MVEAVFDAPVFSDQTGQVLGAEAALAFGSGQEIEVEFIGAVFGLGASFF